MPWWRRRRQREFEDEIRAHLELEADQLRREGVDPRDAAFEARRRFGNVGAAQERFHDARGWLWLEHLLQDLRYAARSLAKAPAFSVIAVLTLALGIGANTAVFSVVNGVLLRPFPFEDPGRLVTLWETLPKLPQVMISYPDYLDWKARAHVFDDIAIYSPFGAFTMTGGEVPEHVGAGRASANLFHLLGVRPLLGRDFRPDDDRVGAERVALLTEPYWRKRFGADPSVVGRKLTLDGQLYVVVGVVPTTLNPTMVDLWAPVAVFAESDSYTRQNHPGLIGLARLKPGVTIERMRAELGDISSQLRAEYPKDDAGIGADGEFFTKLAVHNIRPALVVLTWAVAFVLLIACSNVANLFFARSASRRKEIALRTAIGASRSRVVRLLFTESVLLSLVGGAGGVLLAYEGVRALVAAKPAAIPRLAEIHVDARVLAFAIAVSALTGVLFGLAPALQGTRVNPVDALKESGRGSSASAGALRLRHALMTVEVALALVLIVGAGLLARSFAKLVGVNPGVDTRGVVTARINLPRNKYADLARQWAVLREILARVKGLPSVGGAAFTSALPLGANTQMKITFEGHPRAKGSEPLLNIVYVSPEYFATMRMRVLAGRGIEPADDERSPLVAVLSESAARHFLPGENAVGKRIKRGPFDSAAPPWTVVGIVNDVTESDFTDQPLGMIYLPFAQEGENWANLAVRTPASPESIVPMLRRAVAAVDRDLALTNLSTLDETISRSIAAQRFTMLVLVVFAVAALVLAAVGVYGVIAYIVAQREHEFGIRAALGARAGDVVMLVARRVLGTTLVGLAIGFVATTLSRELIGKLLFEIAPTDRVSYIVGALLLTAVALLAAAAPTLRAMRVSPAEALRTE